MIRAPRIVISGSHSGVGKTTVATALMAAFTRRGFRIQPFKVGPDFIDPGFHQAACGRVSRNLDGWMLSRLTNLEVFARAAADADLAIVEGVMGLFDGRSGSSEEGSTAEMAKWLRAPALLVADAGAMARSAAALVRGFETFDPKLDLAGILFNRIGGAGHAELLRESVSQYCATEVIGCLPRDASIAIPSRHLGLTLAAESLTEANLTQMAGWIEANLDLDRLLALSRHRSSPVDEPSEVAPAERAAVRIAIARDHAFCFYYQDNLDLLEQAGAALVPFSPLRDAGLPPDLDLVYLGGGYPELPAERLASNVALAESVRAYHRQGGKIYAECGGLMYCGRELIDADGRAFPMLGLLPVRTVMQKRFAALGYVTWRAAETTLLGPPGTEVRGHEFHYSRLEPLGPLQPAARLRRDGEAEKPDGFTEGGLLAGYAHLHFASNPGAAAVLVGLPS